METWLLVVTGIFVHLIFFYSIFDIYFTSPLVHGMSPYTAPVKPPAKRLVLFVTDGLRADKFFTLDEDGKTRAHYLRNVIENVGAWGVSHTRVPTESRPGHVAMIAGFYEDVSAVAKGWKENPVEFDSVFNESRYTWSWGSPDILPMFAKGASGGHVFMDYYPSENEDFAASDASKLDTWVFDKIKVFFDSAKNNVTLQSMMRRDKIVFFLHLLGLDTNGHSHKPFSEDYMENIRTVDKGIENLVKLMDEFYHHDNATAYVMSADHGMTDWGSHGAGHPSETLTPLVMWGAGVRGPNRPGNAEEYKDGFSQVWSLGGIGRKDVQQADIAPLMSALIGVPFPLNSVGTLPIDLLNMSVPEKAQMLFANAQQILAQFQVKMEEKRLTTLKLVFRPFGPLTEDKQVFMLRNIKNLLKNGLYDEAIKESYTLISSALEGLRYYQTYDRLFLGVSIVCGYLGWMSYILTLILREHCGLSTERTALDKLRHPSVLSDTCINVTAGVVMIIVFTLLTVQSLPWTNYLYCLLPVILWTVVLKRWFTFKCALQHLLATRKFEIILAVLFCIGGLEILVAGFFHRELLSVGLVCMGLWPLASGIPRLTCSQKTSQYGWCISCILLSIFPLLPVVGRDINYNLVLLAGVLGVIIAVIAVLKLNTSDRSKRNTHIGLLFQICIILIIISTIVVYTTSQSIKAATGLPWVNRLISWSTLASALVLPLLSETGILHRLLLIALSVLPTYLLLSISHEGLFILCLCITLYFWLRVESDQNKKKTPIYLQLDKADFCVELKIGDNQRQLVISDIRRALFYIFFILTAFFGTGNIASINSFEPASVYCFLTVFNPFVMGTLMMLKNVIPLILVSCVFTAIHVTSHIPTRALFLLVLLMSDLMAINFFFLVQDYGSWLEIGTSISHYVIVMCMNIFLMLLFVLSNILTSKRISLNKVKSK
ncbi:hypothetical protein FSP39_014966 [Pinctada imbricata]|uniref:GPI ethanolamine phosphate transferase 1 n=1 Tax=Pinctada imbricata TaxID=66713 RepID=A0AA89BKR2_PINIB|nr:hypothetical protein FSP39_014966 [Pinctada imbricata]